MCTGSKYSRHSTLKLTKDIKINCKTEQALQQALHIGDMQNSMSTGVGDL